jgi:PTS system nitrogen regulatory IIA component
MQIIDFLTLERTFFGCDFSSKKRALEFLSQLFVNELQVASSDLFEAFIERERLGSTVLGHGIALPHIRTHAAKQPLGALIKLVQPIDFNGTLEQKVDVLFALVVPAEACQDHLQILASLAQHFSQPDFRQQLEQANDAKSLYKIVIRP